MEWGRIALIDLYDCNEEKIRNKREIKRFVNQLCTEINMNKVGKTGIKRFGEGKLKGYSAMQFISTSSITIHCDEIDKRVFIDIFSCKNFDKNRMEKFSNQFFNAKKSKTRIIKRR